MPRLELRPSARLLTAPQMRACLSLLVSSILLLTGVLRGSSAQTLLLPTPNRYLLAVGQEGKFYVGTTGKPWTSGMFGCVRSSGGQFHEGLDIRCLERDRRGEPTDPIFATADGTVVYCSRKPSLSNYGNYVVIRHSIDGVDLYSL